MTNDHLREIDYLRVFGLITIVVIHSLNYFLSLPGANPISHTLQELTVNLLRYGRYIFMFVTGLVLFYSYKDRKLNIHRFYKRRLQNLIIPYAFWTAIYLLICRWSNMIEWSNLGGFASVWLRNLLSGNAFYHLYYIVVTIQFYLFLPVLLLLFKPRRPRLWVGIILTSGFFLCLFYHYVLEIQGSRIIGLAAGTPWAGIAGWVLQYDNRLLFSYLPFYLLGGLTGIYLEDFRKWLTKHQYLIGVGLLFSAAVLIGEYFYYYRYLGQSWVLTISVFKPSMYLYSIMVIAMLFRLSLVMEHWGSLHALTNILSANSLGIYLMHPAVLFLLHTYYLWNQDIPNYLLVIIDTPAAIAASCIISLLIGSNRYTRFIIGKAGNLSLPQLSWKNLFYIKVWKKS